MLRLTLRLRYLKSILNRLLDKQLLNSISKFLVSFFNRGRSYVKIYLLLIIIANLISLSKYLKLIDILFRNANNIAFIERFL